MMAALTQEQINELSDIANSGESGARVQYYTKLKEFGIPYGSLALGVVLEDQISGRMANAYFMTVAAQEGKNVTAQQWSAIGDGLMQADLAARLAAEDVDSDGNVTYPDLGYEAIRNYHAAVFDTLGGTVAPGEGVSNGRSATAIRTIPTKARAVPKREKNHGPDQNEPRRGPLFASVQTVNRLRLPA